MNALRYKPYIDHVAITLWKSINRDACPMDLGDFKQAGMVGALEAIRKKDPSSQTFVAYIKLRAKGEMIDELRRHRTSARRKHARDTIAFYGHDAMEGFLKQLEDDTSLEDEVDKEMMLGRVLERLNRVLSEVEVKLIESHCLQGRTFVELAPAFGVSAEALCVRLKVALGKLAKINRS